MSNPQTNWNHGTEMQEEALLHRPLSHCNCSCVVKGKQSLLKHPDWFWDFLFNGYKRLSLGLKRVECKLTTHCRLEVRLRMNGAIPPGPPCAYMADIGTTLPLHCKGYKGSGFHFGTMYRRLGFLLTFPTHYVTGC